MRRMRHSKILQHHRIRIANTHTHAHKCMRRMRSGCNHHSKILQHRRIRIANTHTHTNACDVCDPLVTITPRCYNIIASESQTHTRTRIALRRMRSGCNHHSKILQHHRIRIANTHTRTQTHATYAIRLCNHHSKILQHHRIRIAITHTHTHTYDACDTLVTISEIQAKFHMNTEMIEMHVSTLA